MTGLIRSLVDAALLPIRAAMRRLVVNVITLTIATVSALLAIAFGLAATTSWLARHLGNAEADLVMAGVFVAIALAAVVVRSLLNRRRPATVSRREADELAALVQREPGLGLEAAALVGARDLVRSLTPLQLALVALLAGFIGGRLLDRRD